jgi:hypothetical protein
MRLPLVAPQGRVGVVLDYAQIIVGSLLVAAGTNLFFVPNNVISGAFVAITPAQEMLGEGFAPHAGEEGS